MKHQTFFLCLLFCVASAVKGDDIATIRSFLAAKTDDATVLHGVYTACQNLTRTGTADAVPVLKQLLDDERFSTVAQTALTNIPGDAGIKALRESLDTLHGKNLIGVIQALGTVRDAESVPKIVEKAANDELAEAAFRAIGNIASPPAADAIVNRLTKQGSSTIWLTEAALDAADRLGQNGNKPLAMSLYGVVSRLGFGPGKDTARLNMILLDGLPMLEHLLREKDDATFPIVQKAVLELKSDDTGTSVLDNMANLPVEKQAALVRNLGVRKDTKIVPRLMELANGDKPELRLAAVEALGEIGDPQAVNVLLSAAGSSDDALVNAATIGLKLFKNDDLNKKIIAMLDGNDKKRRLVALILVGQCQVDGAIDKVKMLFTDSDAEIRIAAYAAFARTATATTEDVRLLLAPLKTAKENEHDAVREALTILCIKTADREKVVDLFESELKNVDSQAGNFYLDSLFQLGGVKAAACLAAVAMGTDDGLTDKATQLLGLWITPDVAPYLFSLAEKHPNERYRRRALSGYMRVIQQLGLPVGEKVIMAQKALDIAKQDADKQRATELLTRFQAMLKGKPIFDGKTFDGWEFRNNEKWFRIEDGAIVGGTLKEPIPHNEFLVSKKEYGDFTLRLECKAIGKGCNGGVQFRSFRTPEDGKRPNEMIGYQADMTDTANYWGAIYCESRRNRFVAEPKRELIESIFRPNDWNEYEIVCRGDNIKLYLNGTLTVDYTETDTTIPPRGIFGLQIHSGPPSETSYRNIRIEEW